LIRVNAQGARYPITVDPFFQQAKLIASDGAANLAFGVSVAASGDTIVVGEIGGAGAAYVFVKPAGGWASGTETAKLTASDASAGSSFGFDVAVSGDTVVVAAPTATVGGNFEQGAVYVFGKPAGGWSGNLTENAKLTASHGAAYGLLGQTVDVSGDTVVAATNQGPADYVFVKPAGGWASETETAVLTDSDTSPYGSLGQHVAISGDTIVASAEGATVGSNHGQGAAYVFVKPAGGWASGTETAKLTNSDGTAFNAFGNAVAISGDTIVVGANQFPPNAAYVFVKPAGGWSGNLTENAKLTLSAGEATQESFPSSVAVSGDTVVAGAVNAGPLHISTDIWQGAAYVFAKPAGGWASETETQKLTAADATGSDQLGGSVGISADTIVVGDASKTVSGNADQGAAYVFAPDTTAPTTMISLSPASPNGSNGWYRSSVHATVSASDDSGGSGVAETRCVLDPTTPPASFDDLPADCAYTGAGMDVTTNGTHTLYAASEDNVGNKEAIESVSFKIDQTPPTVTCGTTPVFALGGPGGNVSATVTDAPSGPAASPVLAAVTSADTATAGPGTKALTGFDNAGNQTTVNCPYTVGYQFLGFFSPLPRQYVNASSTVSVKFALADITGTRISDAQAQAIAAACNARILFTALTPSPNCFSYDPTGKQFVFNLRTPRGVTGLATITAEVFSGATVLNIASTQINLR
jgi:hypothetical protein